MVIFGLPGPLFFAILIFGIPDFSCKFERSCVNTGATTTVYIYIVAC